MSSTSTESWCLLGNKIPKSEIVYFCQMTVVYIIIITSIVNLSMKNGSSELWISLLSSAIGYVLPNPSLKTEKL
jgi:FtsH-binding integral membrane protein